MSLTADPINMESRVRSFFIRREGKVSVPGMIRHFKNTSSLAKYDATSVLG
jgi:hypothetical protein